MGEWVWFETQDHICFTHGSKTKDGIEANDLRMSAFSDWTAVIRVVVKILTDHNNFNKNRHSTGRIGSLECERCEEEKEETLSAGIPSADKLKTYFRQDRRN